MTIRKSFGTASKGTSFFEITPEELTKQDSCAILCYIMENTVDSISAPEELLGAEIDGFRLESLLGCGSYGVVYQARHLVMDRLFAFKILFAEFSDNRESVNEFFRESKTAAKLEHPNVVQAYQAGRTPEGLCYFVMEYVDGSSIEELRINSPEQLSLKFLLEISIQLADALDYAWRSRGIIHRDIKPGNLLVCRSDGKLKLADLGLAGVGANAGSGEILATPLYMPPEVATGQKSTHAVSDIYSFGVMFYELAAGKPPFTGSVEALQQAHIETIPQPLFEANPDLDPELAAYIDSMLAKSPEERPQSWAEIKERLTAFKERLFFSQQIPVGAAEFLSPDTKVTNWEKEAGNNHSRLIIAAVILAVVIGAIVVMILL